MEHKQLMEYLEKNYNRAKELLIHREKQSVGSKFNDFDVFFRIEENGIVFKTHILTFSIEKKDIEMTDEEFLDYVSYFEHEHEHLSIQEKIEKLFNASYAIETFTYAQFWNNVLIDELQCKMQLKFGRTMNKCGGSFIFKEGYCFLKPLFLNKDGFTFNYNTPEFDGERYKSEEFNFSLKELNMSNEEFISIYTRKKNKSELEEKQQQLKKLEKEITKLKEKI